MIDQIISHGDKIELYKVSSDGNEYQHFRAYKSKFIDYIDKDKVRILMPIYGSKMVPIEIGDKYNLCFYTNLGLFRCVGLIKESYHQQNVFILVVQFITELNRIQRREFFRVSCLIKTLYRKIYFKEKFMMNKIEEDSFETEEDKKMCYEELQEINRNMLEGVITDISGGGAKINSKAQHEINERVLIKMPMLKDLDAKNNCLSAIVVSSIQISEDSSIYETRVKFTDISSEDREKIVKFVFEQQRKLRHKEKGQGI